MPSPGRRTMAGRESRRSVSVWAVRVALAYTGLCAAKALYDDVRMVQDVADRVPFGVQAAQHVGILTVLQFFCIPWGFCLGVMLYLINSLAWWPIRATLLTLKLQATPHILFRVHIVGAAMLIVAVENQGSLAQHALSFMSLVAVGSLVRFGFKEILKDEVKEFEEDWSVCCLAVIVQSVAALPVGDIMGTISLAAVVNWMELDVSDPAFYQIGIITLGIAGCLMGWLLTRRVRRLSRDG